jgi:hypothetical protein
VNSPGLRLAFAWLGWIAARIGRPGQLGLALLILAVLSCVFLVKPLETDLSVVHARVERVASRPPEPPARVDQEQAWMTRLPTSHAGHAYLARLFKAAESAGLRLEEGRYRETMDAASGLTRLSIALPVNGGYAGIRTFLALALAGEPSLALEGIRLSRDEPGARDIRGEVRFVLLLGSKP